ncbi:MAG: OsmC family protein [Alphaproteobacteria bacterium]
MLAMDPAVRAGYRGIRVAVSVDSDASEAVMRDLVGFAIAHSPVFNTVMNPVPVTVSVAGEAVQVAA